MALTATQLIQRTRRFMGDWPELDASTASISTGGTTLSVASSTSYFANELLQMDNEAIGVTSVASGTTLTVRRGLRGSTAASHASGTTILVNPAFTDMEYLDALNAAILASFPLIYRPVVDESLSSTPGIYEFTVPNMPDTYDGSTIPVPRIGRVSIKETADLVYRTKNDWNVLRGTTPKLKFRRDEAQGTIRIEGYGPIPPLADFSASLDTLFPAQAVDFLRLYAASELLSSGENRRVRVDTGLTDQREQANRTGSSTAAGRDLLGRAYQRLRDSALPPFPKHVVATF